MVAGDERREYEMDMRRREEENGERSLRRGAEEARMLAAKMHANAMRAGLKPRYANVDEYDDLATPTRDDMMKDEEERAKSNTKATGSGSRRKATVPKKLTTEKETLMMLVSDAQRGFANPDPHSIIDVMDVDARKKDEVNITAEQSIPKPTYLPKLKSMEKDDLKSTAAVRHAATQLKMLQPAAPESEPIPTKRRRVPTKVYLEAMADDKSRNMLQRPSRKKRKTTTETALDVNGGDSNNKTDEKTTTKPSGVGVGGGDGGTDSIAPTENKEKKKKKKKKKTESSGVTAPPAASGPVILEQKDVLVSMENADGENVMRIDEVLDAEQVRAASSLKRQPKMSAKKAALMSSPSSQNKMKKKDTKQRKSKTTTTTTTTTNAAVIDVSNGDVQGEMDAPQKREVLSTVLPHGEETKRIGLADDTNKLQLHEKDRMKDHVSRTTVPVAANDPVPSTTPAAGMTTRDSGAVGEPKKASRLIRVGDSGLSIKVDESTAPRPIVDESSDGGQKVIAGASKKKLKAPSPPKTDAPRSKTVGGHVPIVASSIQNLENMLKGTAGPKKEASLSKVAAAIALPIVEAERKLGKVVIKKRPVKVDKVLVARKPATATPASAASAPPPAVAATAAEPPPARSPLSAPTEAASLSPKRRVAVHPPVRVRIVNSKKRRDSSSDSDKNTDENRIGDNITRAPSPPMEAVATARVELAPLRTIEIPPSTKNATTNDSEKEKKEVVDESTRHRPFSARRSARHRPGGIVGETGYEMEQPSMAVVEPPRIRVGPEYQADIPELSPSVVPPETTGYIEGTSLSHEMDASVMRQKRPWTTSESFAFCIGMHLFGKKFQKIAKLVKTRETYELVHYYYMSFKQTRDYVVWKQLSRDMKHSGAALLRGQHAKFLDVLERSINNATNMETVRSFTQAFNDPADPTGIDVYIDQMLCNMDADTLVGAISKTADIESISRELDYIGPIGPALKRLDNGESVDDFFMSENADAGLDSLYWRTLARRGWSVREHCAETGANGAGGNGMPVDCNEPDGFNTGSTSANGARFIFSTPPLPGPHGSTTLTSKTLHGFKEVLLFLRDHPKLLPQEFVRALKEAKSRARIERRARGANPDFCPNCGTTQTPYWRKCVVTGDIMCNACALYAKSHGVMRPVSYFGRTGKGGREAEKPPPSSSLDLNPAPLSTAKQLILPSNYSDKIKGRALSQKFEDAFWNKSLWSDHEDRADAAGAPATEPADSAAAATTAATATAAVAVAAVSPMDAAMSSMDVATPVHDAVVRRRDVHEVPDEVRHAPAPAPPQVSAAVIPSTPMMLSDFKATFDEIGASLDQIRAEVEKLVEV